MKAHLTKYAQKCSKRDVHLIKASDKILDDLVTNYVVGGEQEFLCGTDEVRKVIASICIW